jgi:hypothetical protein
MVAYLLLSNYGHVKGGKAKVFLRNNDFSIKFIGLIQLGI